MINLKSYCVLFIFDEIFKQKKLYTRNQLALKLGCTLRSLTNYIQEVNAYLFNNSIYKFIRVVDGYYRVVEI